MNRLASMLSAIDAHMPQIKSERCRNRMSSHWVYLITGPCGNLLYVGMTGNVKSRISDHKRASSFWCDGCEVEYIECKTRRSALNYEAHIIKERKPIYNKMHA